MTARSGRYVYAVARGIAEADLARLTGLRGAAVRGIEHDGLTAVVSDVDLDEFGDEGLRENLENLGWLEEVARTHHAVVHEVAVRAPAAPLRLATIYLDDDAVRSLLDELRGPLQRALERIQGRMEWSVKAFAPPATVEPPPEDSAPSGAGAGTAYLMRRKAAVARQQEAAEEGAALAEHLHLALSQHAVASRRLQPQDRRLSGHEGTMTLNGAYLVANEDAEEFLTAARRLDAEHPDARLDVNGPWPPYSFVTLEDA